MRIRWSQAWAEFCIAYCKRLDPLLAIPAAQIRCPLQKVRFIHGRGVDRVLSSSEHFTNTALLGRPLAPLFHRKKLA
jgi:hypothetical protein